ncbi:MAG: cysteine desulfurase [Crocinitomicaceae bacterium]|jgi:cysteine desulfurase|nr:cysteine desulfurase [Crocinitomicaceae bacterium]
MRVYLDNAATTPVAPEVVEAMIPVLRETFGNPSSTHSFGRNAKALLETSRRTVAKHLNCSPSEIIFTSGGTEADNMAIHSAVTQLGVKRIITSAIEHHAVGHTADAISLHEKIELVLVNLDSKGNVDLAHLETLLKENKPTLVSLMHANNEIATMIPLKKVADLCRQYNAYFHSDTVQTMAHYAFDLKELDIDFITCAAHKFHGPKGIGFLYVNKKTRVSSFIHGGAQERGLRGGTENIAGIVGLAKAMDLAYEDVEGHQKHVYELKSFMIQELKTMFPTVAFHGETDSDKALYTVLNVCLPATDKTSMLLFTLDLKGVAVSGGSACTSGATKGSHVLEGIGADMSRPNVRFSFSRYTTKEEIEYALLQLQRAYEQNLS